MAWKQAYNQFHAERKWETIICATCGWENAPALTLVRSAKTAKWIEMNLFRAAVYLKCAHLPPFSRQLIFPLQHWRAAVSGCFNFRWLPFFYSSFSFNTLNAMTCVHSVNEIYLKNALRRKKHYALTGTLVFRLAFYKYIHIHTFIIYDLPNHIWSNWSTFSTFRFAFPFALSFSLILPLSI